MKTSTLICISLFVLLYSASFVRAQCECCEGDGCDCSSNLESGCSCCNSGISWWSYWWLWFVIILMLLACCGGGYRYRRIYYRRAIIVDGDYVPYQDGVQYAAYPIYAPQAPISVATGYPASYAPPPVIQANPYVPPQAPTMMKR